MISRLHHLVIFVRKSADAPTIVEHFTFAGVDFVLALWEYSFWVKASRTPRCT